MFKKRDLKTISVRIKSGLSKEFNRVSNEDIENSLDVLLEKISSSSKVALAIREVVKEHLTELQQEKESRKITRIYRGRKKRI